MLVNKRGLPREASGYKYEQGALAQMAFCAKCADPAAKPHLFSPTRKKNFFGFGASRTESRGMLGVDLRRAALMPGNMLSVDAIQERVGYSTRVAAEHFACGERNAVNSYLS